MMKLAKVSPTDEKLAKSQPKANSLQKSWINSYALRFPELYPSSCCLVDPLPKAPSASDPNQRIVTRVEHASLQPMLQITNAGNRIRNQEDGHIQASTSTNPHEMADFVASDKLRHRKLGDRVCCRNKKSVAMTPHSETEAVIQVAETASECISTGYRESLKRLILRKLLNLADFRPLHAPYVPYAIRLLVYSIEVTCKLTEGWSALCEMYPQFREEAITHACILLQNWRQPSRLQALTEGLALPLRIATLRCILAGCKRKPLHFSREMLMETLKRPLYDLFLRPNPEIVTIVRHTALPTSRTDMDTLAFLMTHLLHGLEKVHNGMKAKSRLALVYGPLLISFAERPIVLDRPRDDHRVEESILMEVILEVCDATFWNNLSMLQVEHAFDGHCGGPRFVTKSACSRQQQDNQQILSTQTLSSSISATLLSETENYVEQVHLAKDSPQYKAKPIKSSENMTNQIADQSKLQISEKCIMVLKDGPNGQRMHLVQALRGVDELLNDCRIEFSKL